ncbi:IclR family transcriptional regulator, partial [Achromobacter xylosoxidans]
GDPGLMGIGWAMLRRDLMVVGSVVLIAAEARTRAKGLVVVQERIPAGAGEVTIILQGVQDIGGGGIGMLRWRPRRLKTPAGATPARRGKA